MSQSYLLKTLMECSEAIGQSGSSNLKLYKQRLTCLMDMKEYELAVQDAEMAISIDNKFLVAYFNAMDCYLILGNVEAAEKVLLKLRQAATRIVLCKIPQVPKIENFKRLKQSIDEEIASGNIDPCLNSVNEALKIASACWDLKFLKLKCLIINKQFEEVDLVNSQLCSSLPHIYDFTEPLRLYYDGKLDQSLKLFKKIPLKTSLKYKSFQAVKQQTETLIAGTSEGNYLKAQQKYEEAFERFESLLKVDPSNKEVKKMLYVEMATAVRLETQTFPSKDSSFEFKQNDLDASLIDCDSILNSELIDRERDYLGSLKEMISSAIADDEEASLYHVIDYDSDSPPEQFLYSSSASSDSSEPELMETSTNTSQSSQYSFTGPTTNELTEQPNARTQQEQEEQEANEKAVAKNEAAYKDFEAKRYQSAIDKFTEAIALNPKNAVYIGNRAACYLDMGKVQLAMSDALKAIDLDCKYWEGYSSAVNSLIILGEIKIADMFVKNFENNAKVYSLKFKEVLKLENAKLFNLNVETNFKDKDYTECLKNIDSALKIATKCTLYLNLKTECFIMLERYKEAQGTINKLFALNDRDPNVMYLKGLQLYHEGSMLASVKHFEDALRADPDFTKALNYRSNAKKLHNFTDKYKKEAEERQFPLTIDTITSALELDPLPKKMQFELLSDRGVASFNIKSYKSAFTDFSDALKVQQNSAKLLFLRARVHFEFDEYEDCLVDAEESLKLQTDQQSKEKTMKLIDEAKIMLEAIDPKTPFDVLGISVFTDSEEVKKAFNRLSLLYHPDKHPNATEVEKKKLARKFQEVKDAHDSVIKKFSW